MKNNKIPLFRDISMYYTDDSINTGVTKYKLSNECILDEKFTLLLYNDYSNVSHKRYELIWEVEGGYISRFLFPNNLLGCTLHLVSFSKEEDCLVFVLYSKTNIMRAKWRYKEKYNKELLINNFYDIKRIPRKKEDSIIFKEINDEIKKYIKIS